MQHYYFYFLYLKGTPLRSCRVTHFKEYFQKFVFLLVKVP